MISTDIDKAVRFLNKNDIIGFPTETVYGLAGNIYSKKAIDKIYNIKKRPLFNPLIVHVKAFEELHKIVLKIPFTAEKLADKFWPGPLTLLLEKQPNVPDYITAGNRIVAVRMPNHPVALALLNKLDYPLAAPSANPYTFISPTSAEQVAQYFGDNLPIILQGGICKAGIESTIIGFEYDKPTIYRFGAISQEDIEAVIGKLKINNKNDVKPKAPGMTLRHYAPQSILLLSNHILKDIELFSNKKIGLLLFHQPINNKNIKYQIVLSKTGDLKEATSNFYAALHQLDNQNLDIIIAERFPDNDLGRTINDRLERATLK